MGPVEQAVRDDIGELGDLVGMEPSLAEVAYRLAQQVDGAPEKACSSCGEPIPVQEEKILPQLTKELRVTLIQLLEGRATEDDDDDLGDLDTPE